MDFKIRKSKGRQYLDLMNSGTLGKKSNSQIISGGAYSEISQEEKDKIKNVVTVKSEKISQQPLAQAPISTKHKLISDEKLKRFIDFKI